MTANHGFRVLNLETGEAVRTFWSRMTGNRHARVSEVALRPNTSEILAAEGAEVVIYDWASGRFVASLGKYGNVRFQEGIVYVNGDRTKDESGVYHVDSGSGEIRRLPMPFPEAVSVLAVGVND